MRLQIVAVERRPDKHPHIHRSRSHDVHFVDSNGQADGASSKQTPTARARPTSTGTLARPAPQLRHSRAGIAGGGSHVFGLRDDPCLPDPGDVYWVDTSILDNHDPKSKRPALVARVPHSLTGRIILVTRTTDLTRTPGVLSPPDRNIQLNKPGIWGHVASAEASLWTPSMVTWCGCVNAAHLQAVREEFQL